jgi:very-short-patch-repair endonuclease
MSAKAIDHRLRAGRLHPLYRGVYAVGRPQVGRLGGWMAAALACGPSACLSHWSAAFLWGILPHEVRPSIDVTIRRRSFRRRPGISVRCRPSLDDPDITTRRGIPVTTPVFTLLDLATILSPHRLDSAVNEADRLDLVDPESLRAALAERAGRPGVRVLRDLLDRHTFRLTESDLERLFLRVVRNAGPPTPETQVWLNGHRVDFFWPDLGLVVETDGLRYHRTAARQSVDARRDQAHIAAGLTVLRFSHAQIKFERRRVEATLGRVAERLA